MSASLTIYLDHAATTPLSEAARAAMAPYLDERFGNASSAHAPGREARKGVDEARERVAAAVGARPDEIVFTSGGTEADNLAIKGAAWHAREQGRDGIVVTAIEHHAVLDPSRWLARQGFRVREVGVDEHGVVRLDALAAAVDDKTALVSVMWANNEVGTIQPVAEAARIAHDAGAVFHTDAVQAVPWLNVEAGIADLLTIAAHKHGGPKGVGALVVRRGVKIQPLLHGGGQEREVRSGTYNVAGIVGFGAAAEETALHRNVWASAVGPLRDRLQRHLSERIPGVRVNGHPAERLPNNLHVCIEGIDGEPLILLLDAAGVAASQGSACSSGAAEPSYVLAALGVPRDLARGTLRLTLGRGTTEVEIDRAAEAIVDGVARLRR
ncbi:MAG TPA: cysteine desulfurase family protein [Actinomycetota bacterium]|nr:cysteine desulfurase family protein [Actinomycetota bacterium]